VSTDAKDLVVELFVPILCTLLAGVSCLVGAGGKFWDAGVDFSYLPALTRFKYFLVSTAFIWLAFLLFIALHGGNEFAVSRAISSGAAGPNLEPPPPQYKVRGHVDDFAGILNSHARSDLNRIGKELENNRKTQIAFVIVTSLNNISMDDLMAQLTKSWGVGDKANDRSILVLFSLQERRCRISASPTFSWEISPADADRLVEEMAPAIEKGNYGDALEFAGGRIQRKLLH